VSVITKHGRPVILAVPFDQRLLQEGVNRSLAIRLYEGAEVSLAQAAKVAGLHMDGFLDLLDTAGVPAVDYPPEELEDEAEIAG
jgi:predicted HTH domain antitoxin